MTKRIKLSGKNIQLNNTPPVTSTSITISHGNRKQNAEQLKQQILDDHEKINRLKQIFALHKKHGAPVNIPELTGVGQGVIDQIQNVITSVLKYIEEGKVPNGYTTIKKTVVEP